MLVLARKQEESLIIGEKVEVKVLEVRGDQVRLGIVAPRNVSIYRKELYEKMREENVASVKTKQDKVEVPLDRRKGGEAETTTQKRALDTQGGTKDIGRNKEV
ncbi:MAG: carbon storage regulator CsrA [Candidatus Omnitrophica bacterium]|nr:carbon storage regulator CsrA [Candidatus Omnitrophota bacterium]